MPQRANSGFVIHFETRSHHHMVFVISTPVHFSDPLGVETLPRLRHRQTPIPKHTSLLTTLKTNPTLDPRRNNSPIKLSGSIEQQQQFELSGSDILFALQRATTQTAKNKNKRRDPHAYPSNKSRGGSGSDGEEDEFDYNNLRPIYVKSDWGSRLDELAKRLTELLDIEEEA